MPNPATPGIPVTGSRSKSRYTKRVTDKGRVFVSEKGEEMDEKAFRALEDDYTEDAGNTMTGKDLRGSMRGSSYSRQKVAVAQPKAAPVIREESDLGAAARAVKASEGKSTPEEKERKKKNQMSALGY